MHDTRRAMKAARVKPSAPRDSDTYLRRLGERVRMLRHQRGMSLSLIHI